MANDSVVQALAELGGVALFGGLMWSLLRSQLSQAKAERSEWLTAMREDSAATREGLRQVSEALIEIRTVIRSKDRDT